MKSAILFFVSMFSISAIAATDGTTSVMSTPKVSGTTEKVHITEVGMQYSSISDGTPHATVGFIREWDNGFAMGARGLMPMTFSRQAQSYMGQIVSRFILLNERDQMFIEPTVAMGYYTGRTDSGAFTMFGASYGYLHKFDNTLALGASLGVDYGTNRITEDGLENGFTLYNKFAITGSYYF